MWLLLVCLSGKAAAHPVYKISKIVQEKIKRGLEAQGSNGN